ncbi:transposase [Roseateles flavus]|uniref:Transposase n=1 Tax=Roseateles flavus TaxID=3149041 RepID=A0ABV0GI62_9BURK
MTSVGTVKWFDGTNRRTKSEDARIHQRLDGYVRTMDQAAPGCRRRVHSAEFKAQAVRALQQPGVSMAAVAMAHGINANLLRRWVHEFANSGAVAGASCIALASRMTSRKNGALSTRCESVAITEDHLRKPELGCYRAPVSHRCLVA